MNSPTPLKSVNPNLTHPKTTYCVELYENKGGWGGTTPLR